MHDLVIELQELQGYRKFHIATANKVTNAAGAFVRRALGWAPDAPDKEEIVARAAKVVALAMAGKGIGDDLAPLAPHLGALRAGLEPIRAAREEVERAMRRAARKLPAYAFAKDVKGFGDLGLAALIGEAGELSRYATVEKIWKRLGLAPYEGKAYSTWRRTGGLSAEDWTLAGYAPRRRAEVYAVIQDPLFRHQTVSQGPYRAAYDVRRARTAETHPDWTKAHSHADAGRVMVKALVSDLWSEWRKAVAGMPAKATEDVPSSTLALGVEVAA